MKTLLAIAALALAAGAAQGAPKTICTITVNSPDEKRMLAKRLPKGEYRFEELVEKGRPDWLRGACQRRIRCDALVISGHFNAGETFYSDRLDVDEHLAIDELERAACSDSCPGLFANLKEVYLFGCESLNPDATKYSSAFGESGRSRMRRIFSGVPVIYGFSSSAPVGPTAAMLLERYFNAGGGPIGTGRPNQKLLRAFSRNSMIAVSGATDPAQRQRICRFFDDRMDAAQRLAYVHELMRGGMGDVEAFLARIEKLFAALSEEERATAAFQAASAGLAADSGARERYLAHARQAAAPTRARMIALAVQLGWLDEPQRRTEQLALAESLLARRTLGFAEVGLLCDLNRDRHLDAEHSRLPMSGGKPLSTGHAAALACLGDPAAQAQVLEALASPRDADVQVAQAYLRHRPLEDESKLRPVVADIARMPPSHAKVRALDALSKHYISDEEILDALAHAFADARSAPVQQAIAGVLVRSDYRKPGLASILREHRLDKPGSGSLVDVLIARLPAS